MKIYIGNLSTDTTDAQLAELAGPFGKPTSASVVRERDGGGSRGFGFIEFASSAEGNAAILGVNGKNVAGQTLKASEAKSRDTKPLNGRY